jgi:hypothetical protein
MAATTKPMAAIKTTNEQKYDLEYESKEASTKDRKELLSTSEPTVNPEG